MCQALFLLGQKPRFFLREALDPLLREIKSLNDRIIGPGCKIADPVGHVDLIRHRIYRNSDGGKTVRVGIGHGHNGIGGAVDHRDIAVGPRFVESCWLQGRVGRTVNDGTRHVDLVGQRQAIEGAATFAFSPPVPESPEEDLKSEWRFGEDRPSAKPRVCLTFADKGSIIPLLRLAGGGREWRLPCRAVAGCPHAEQHLAQRHHRSSRTQGDGEPILGGRAGAARRWQACSRAKRFSRVTVIRRRFAIP